MTLLNLPKLSNVAVSALAFALIFAACTTGTNEESATGTSAVAASVVSDESGSTSVSTPVIPPTTTSRTYGSQPLSTPELVELLTPSVVQIAVSLPRGQAVGTGVILDKTGLILTNWHVVEGAITITVAFEDGSITEGELFRRDTQLDLAIVRVSGQDNLRPATFGDSAALRIGEDVVAIGHALGLRGGPTVSKGVVSALDRTIVGEAGGDLTGLVQTDAAINEGNSGGPLVNMFGEVVGVNTAKINIGDRIGFAININDAKTAAYSLIAQGPLPPPGFLGVAGVDVTRALARALRLPVGEGFGITVIEPGSPAANAGLELDDIIVKLDSTEITNGQDLTDFLRDHPSGSEITITVVRDSQFLVTLETTLVERTER
ncbi:MAG TPA: trypsin-like serine protease [Dehalococcoidia bacterium]|nr:trypsin-like serine protease [Dehalococcoidia bacterium]HIK88475.1 trypsin-like serine protease [Dehalococcoidia bacterium]